MFTKKTLFSLSKNNLLSINKNKNNFLLNNNSALNTIFYLKQMKLFSRMIPVKLGDLGEGTKEAEIKKWHIKVGDSIDEDDNLVEVGTDKLIADIPSPTKGIVTKINYQPGEVCLVGKPLCEIKSEKEAVQQGKVNKDETSKAKDNSDKCSKNNSDSQRYSQDTIRNNTIPLNKCEIIF